MKKQGLILDNQKVLIAMANKGFNTTDLCRQANINNGTYQRIAKGEPLNTKSASRICNALEVQVLDLLAN